MKFAIVTGTSSGLGRAVVNELLAANWQVLGVSRRPADFEDARYHHSQLDLADPAAVTDFFEAEAPLLIGQPQHLALVNSAGQLGMVGPTGNADMNSLVRVSQLNYLTPVWLMGYLRRNYGKTLLSIVNISSGAAHKPYPGWSQYCSTKAALKIASEVMAAENLAMTKIFSYEPGVLNTPMQDQLRLLDEDEFPAKSKFVKLHEEGKLVDPKLPAQEILEFLENEDSPAFRSSRLGDDR